MTLARIGYILLCVLGPIAWGLVVLWVTNKIEDRYRKERGPNDLPPIDYYI